MTERKTLSRILLANMLLVATLACVSIGGLWIGQEIYSFNVRVTEQSTRLIEERKERMKKEVDGAVAYLDFMRSQVEERTRRLIRGRTLEAHQIATHLYETWKDKKSPEELESMVREALRPIRFLGGRGYYFATRLDGVEMLCAGCAHLEGKNLLDLRDVQGAYVIRDMAELVRKQGEGFYRYTWNKPDTLGRDHHKIAYVKYFAPFDWFIGTGEYVEDTEQDLQQEALDWIRRIRYEDDAYLFAGRWDGMALSGPSTGKNMLEVTDSSGVKIVQEMIRVAREDGGYVGYVMPKIEGQRPAPKISYARGLPAWEWYIGTGLYIDDIEHMVAEARRHSRTGLFLDIAKICAILALLWLSAYGLVARLNARTHAMFQEFSGFFNRSANDQTEMPIEKLAIDEFHELAEGANRMIARRRTAEESLRESESQYKELFNSIPVGYHQYDTEGRLVRVNATELAILGYSEEEMLGHYVWEFVEGSELCRESVLNNLAGDSTPTTGFERYYIKKDGTPVAFLIEDKVLRDQAGRITGIRSVAMDISDRKLSEEKIKHLAFFDQLTGLPNRTLLQDRLKQAMASSQRSDRYGALLLLDLDYFKTLNDTLGHDMGDLLLTQVARRLTDCVREEDTVARQGGDEFVVMLVSLSESQIEAASLVELVGRKIIAALNQAFELKEVSYRISPSIGASLFLGQQTDIDTLLKQADLSMYKAKDVGRNTLRFFDPDMTRDVLKRASLDNDLRDALQKEQFVLHYQAQVTGKRVTGAEALLRWQHPSRGLVFPGDFITVIEETGLILPVGQWVLETACKQLADWATQPEMSHLTIAVNISARQLNQEDFVDQVLSALDCCGAHPQRLKLELTESVLVNRVEDIIGKMTALKEKGVGFSLDDFGTGYSSLAYLKRLPLDQLKIDQSFVRDILTDPNDAAIAKMIVVLAENLGLTVIAEGVETEAQRDSLSQHGCHAYQGYFFSRPLPLADFESFVKRG